MIKTEIRQFAFHLIICIAVCKNAFTMSIIRLAVAINPYCEG